MKSRFVSWVLAILAIAVVALLLTSERPCSAEPSSALPPCCPQCGCHDGLTPVCHSYWTTKKETKYHYCCKCDPICIPDQSPCCSKPGCENADGANQNCCHEVCDCDNGKCNCLIIAQHKLVKFPYTVETPVCKCKIEWVCPRCGCNCSSAAEDNNPFPANSSLPAPPMPPKAASTESNSKTTQANYTATEESNMLAIPIGLLETK